MMDGELVPPQPWADAWCECALIETHPVAVTIKGPDGKFTNLCAECAKAEGVVLMD